MLWLWTVSGPVILKCAFKKFNRPLNLLFNLLSKTNLNHNTNFPKAQVEFYAQGDYGNFWGKLIALSEWGHSEEGYGMAVRQYLYKNRCPQLRAWALRCRDTSPRASSAFSGWGTTHSTTEGILTGTSPCLFPHSCIADLFIAGQGFLIIDHGFKGCICEVLYFL